MITASNINFTQSRMFRRQTNLVRVDDESGLLVGTVHVEISEWDFYCCRTLFDLVFPRLFQQPGTMVTSGPIQL